MYANVARKHGLDMSQMSLAFVRQQGFVTSVLIGATTMEQLRKNIGSAAVQLDAAVLKDLDAVHRAHPNPCP